MSQTPISPPSPALFERVEAASLAIDTLLDSIFGTCPSPESQDLPTSYSNLSQYRAHTSSLSKLIRLTSLKVFSLKASLLHAQTLQEELESRQKTALSIHHTLGLEKPRNEDFGLPTEVLDQIFAYAFPRAHPISCKLLLSRNPWKDVVLRTTTIDVMCGVVVLPKKVDESEVERIASAAPAALSLSMWYDPDYLYPKNTGELLIKALTPHLERCRALDLPMMSHEFCAAVQKAVKEGLLRVERLQMRLNHGPCIVECIAPALLHLHIIVDNTREPRDPIQDILLVLRATPNLRSFSYTSSPISCTPQPLNASLPTDTFTLPHLRSISFKTSLDLTITLVQRLTDVVETPGVRAFRTESVPGSMFKSGYESFPERFIDLIHAKFPRLERLETFSTQPNSTTKNFPARLLQLLSDSTQGANPYLPNLSSIGIQLSHSLINDKPLEGLLEKLARNRVKNQLTVNLSFLELYRGEFGIRVDPLLKERIQLYYPNVTFFDCGPDTLRWD